MPNITDIVNALVQYVDHTGELVTCELHEVGREELIAARRQIDAEIARCDAQAEVWDTPAA